MVSAVVPGVHARLRSRAGRAAAGLGAFARRAARPVRQPLANLASMPLTVAGVACIDAGVFTASLTAGLIVTGLSLIGLEYLIADQP